MAGIGFELKRLFSHKGFLWQFRANLYAGTVIAGPMILGAVLLFGMKFLSGLAGAPGEDQDALIVIITWSLLFPLILTSLFSFVVSRFLADMLFEKRYERILPSMYGVITICLATGGIAWAVFLALQTIPLEYAILSFIIFCEAVVVWIEISYTNALKDYRGVLTGFLLGILAAAFSGYVLVWLLRFPVVTGLLAAVAVAYGVMVTRYTYLLHRHFPLGKGTALRFFIWIDQYPALIFVGFFYTIGLFAHLMIMWGGPWGRHVIGGFYDAPAHDIPVLLAFLTTLVTTINFVTAVETRFYDHYRIYFSLLNEGGALSDIEMAYQELITVLKQELFNLAQVQMFVVIIAVVVFGEMLKTIGLGFTLNMIGVFRVLAIGYGLYAIGNAFMLFQLYVVDYRGALRTAFVLAFVNITGTFITIQLPQTYYGFGFLAAGAAMYIAGWVQLAGFMKKLDYHVFCKQPVFANTEPSRLTRFIERLDSRRNQEYRRA